jgi:glycosyltransferase involved in cell wall biosynthesis
MAKRTVEEIARLLIPAELPPLAENPLVSVLVANYNYGHFVGEAIESVLAQTYPSFEVIVCDDGSTDNSCEIVETYGQRDSRIKLLCQSNQGQAAAQNAAFLKSRGQIVCLLDADDRFLPEKLELVVQAFRSRSDSGFLGHQMFRTDKTRRRLGVSPWIVPPPDGWYGQFIVRHGDVPPGLAFGSALCFRREIGDRIFPLPERFRGYADGVIMVLAPLMTSLIGMPIPLAEYCCHTENISNTARVSQESLERELEINKALWDLRRSYLESVDPCLGEMLPGFDQRLSTLCARYTQARLQSSGDALQAYRNLVRSDQFSQLHVGVRWFLLVSIALPLPLFRYGINLTGRPNRLKQWLWWLFKYAPGKIQQRLFAN